MSANSRIVTVNKDIPLEDIGEFPVLSEVQQWWARSANGALPEKLDILDLPPRSWPYLMLVDLQGHEDARIALAGTAACNLYGYELRGTSLHDFFDERDSLQVLAALHEVAESRKPKLTDRFYVGINGRLWSYTRLLLPLIPDGISVTRVLKALEPKSISPSLK